MPGVCSAASSCVTREVVEEASYLRTGAGMLALSERLEVVPIALTTAVDERLTALSAEVEEPALEVGEARAGDRWKSASRVRLVVFERSMQPPFNPALHGCGLTPGQSWS